MICFVLVRLLSVSVVVESLPSCTSVLTSTVTMQSSTQISVIQDQLITQDQLIDDYIQDPFFATQQSFNTTEESFLESDIFPFQINQSGIIVAIISAAISFITVTGNIMVIYAFCTTKELRSYTNFYIIALSFSDLVAGAFTMPFYSIYWILGYWPFPPLLCDFYAFFNTAFIHISIVMIVAIAYDRWDALEHPMRHLSRRTLSHALLLITISYIVPLLLWLFGTMLWPTFAGGRSIAPGRCYPQYVVDSFAFLIIVPFLIFWIPLLFISILYARILSIIRHSTENRRKNLGISLENLCKITSAEGIISKKTTGHYNSNYIQDDEINPSSQRSKPFNITSATVIEKNHDFVHSIDNSNIANRPIHQQSPLQVVNIPPQQPLNNGDPADINVGLGASTSHPDKKKKDIEVNVNVVRKENLRATRLLTLIFLAMIISSLPWSIIAPVHSTCRECVPLAIYQVRNYC